MWVRRPVPPARAVECVEWQPPARQYRARSREPLPWPEPYNATGLRYPRFSTVLFPIRGEGDRPCIGRSPVLFLRQRVQGFASAIDAILEDLETRAEPPRPLIGIVGIEADSGTTDDGLGEPAETSAYQDEDAEVLLSKPANAEQVRIIKRLERSAGVLVQGPPGTGKSHAIANLIGHLLAQGKTVLVTAHTTKALRVLRQYVVDTLQPLCVSVLDNDLEGRRQLEQSVEGIVERLSAADAGRLRSQVRDLTERRAHLIGCIRAARQSLFRIRQGEYQPIVVAGETFQPSDAARKGGPRRRRSRLDPVLGDPRWRPADV